MQKSTLIANNRIIEKMHVKVHKGHENELLKEILDVNLQREGIFSIVLIIIDIFMLYTDTFAYRELRQTSYSLKNIFYTHIALLIIPSVFLFLVNIRKTGGSNENLKFNRILHLSLIASVLMLCSFLSLNAILSKGQVFSYTIAVFCIASMALLTVGERLLMYFSSYILFIIGIFIMRSSIYELFWNAFFITLLILVALIVSSLNFSAYMGNFNNRKIILQKSKELDNMYKVTEDALKKRTEELTEANKRLINEINAKHDMEIQFMKTRYLCEEKERMLNETVEYEKLRTAFFANISHELRTPLTVIFSAEQMLDLILKNSKLTDNQREVNQYMGIIKQNCYRLIRLIANLIDITKIDAGYIKVNLKNYDIVKIVEDITLSVAKYIEDKNINIIFDTEVEEKVIACDPDKIERIMLNLLSNAVKFTPEGGEIFVNITEGYGKVNISVRDTGVGIPLEMQSVIFDRFVQVDKTTTRRKEGSGIGLSLVKSFVEMHNGSISLISGCGKGSEFIIELPDGTIQLEDIQDEGNELKGGSDIEKINVEFSDIYF